jgi:hypothetical protein
MSEEELGRDLPQRVRGAARGGLAPSASPVLSEELRQRIQAAVKVEREEAAASGEEGLAVSSRHETASEMAGGPAVDGIPGPRRTKPERPVKPECAPKANRPAKTGRVASESQHPAKSQHAAMSQRTVRPRRGAEAEAAPASPASPGHHAPAASGPDCDSTQPGTSDQGRTDRPAQPEPSAPGATPRRRGAKARMVALALAVVVIGSLAAVTVKHFADSAGLAAPTSTDLLRQEAAVRDQAAVWVAQQVSPAVNVSCDQVMCAAITRAGFPSGKLLVLGPTSPIPSNTAVVVVTATVRALFGTSLDTVWAPSVLASFGSGTAEVVVRAIAAHGALAYEDALSQDLNDRKSVGASLLNDNRIAISAKAQSQLMAGLVDSRVLYAVASVAAAHPIDIVDFGNIGRGASPNVPLRFADLAENDHAANVSRLAYVQSMKIALGTAPYLPVRSVSVMQAGQQVLRIEFTAPSPFGLLATPGS